MAKTVDFDGITYWKTRYAHGGGPGKGSRGRLAAFKAEVINGVVEARSIQSAVELGCGPGDQFALLKIPRYTGIDISSASIEACKKRFGGRNDCEFLTSDESNPSRAELAMSLDVVFHLTEDRAFEDYMRRLFASADKFVMIYSSNHNWNVTRDPHVRHRKFTTWIEANAKDWKLVEKVRNRFPRRWPFLRQNRSFCSFYIYAR